MEYLVTEFVGMLTRAVTEPVEVSSHSRSPQSGLGDFVRGRSRRLSFASPRGRWRGCLRGCWRNHLTVPKGDDMDGRRWTTEKPRSTVCRPRSALRVELPAV